MADKLLIRMFDVGLGDFIYCAIPGGHTSGRAFHMVIDCGTLSTQNHLKEAVPILMTWLPQQEGKPYLDLLVVTHQHKDHMSGFALSVWDDISIGAIWMSAAMNPDNPQAERARKLHELAGASLTQADSMGFGYEMNAMFAAYAYSNDDAVKRLTETLPENNNVKPEYVAAGQSAPADLSLPLNKVKIQVLGPEQDIDHYYLGRPATSPISRLVQLAEQGNVGVPAARKDVDFPDNIDAIDFHRLQSRMLSNALAFADSDSTLINNSSVVLLVEWQGKRLLFVGDAEWDGEYSEGKSNMAWNTMWNRQRKLLAEPVHFLKVGHHGSENATPWDEGLEQSPGQQSEPAAILDAILPKGGTQKARAAVSTERKGYKTIPRSQLMSEIGSRIENGKKYRSAFQKANIDPAGLNHFGYEKTYFGNTQPPRTDLENIITGQKFIEIEISGSG